MLIQYQNKKREQAIRMMECIEKRRYHELAQESTDRREPRRKKQWAETASSEVIGSVEERRQAAKTLLLDVQRVMGNQVMKEAAAIVRELSKSYNTRAKHELFSLLQGQPELQKRFLDFLPKSV
jgi:hypothetical protein